MNKLFTKIAALFLGMTMAVGVGVAVSSGSKAYQAKAEETIAKTCSFINKTTGHQTYKEEWIYADDWKINYGANNNKSWAYMKFGSKSADDCLTGAYVGSPIIDKAITKVSVSVIANTGKNTSNMSVSSWKLEVYSDASYSTKIAEVDKSATSIDITESNVFDVVPSAGTSWAKNSYYKVIFNLTNTSSTNGVLWLDKIDFYYDNSSPTPTPTKLSTPTGLTVSGTTMTWNDVSNESGYAYSIINTSTTTETTGSLDSNVVSIDASKLSLQDGDYTFKVKATGDGTNYSDSDYTNPVNFTISSGPTPVTDSYEKVTSTTQLTNGDYLIVCEDEEVAFNGLLTTLDAVGNKIDVSISNSKIVANETTNSAKFTIASITNGYSIKSSSEYYIGKDVAGNGLDSSTSTIYVNTISIEDNGDAVITGAGNSILRYNSASNQTRFRYYGSGQKAIQLYKFVSSAPRIEVECNKTSLGINEQTTLTVTKLNGATGTFTDSVQNNNVELSLPEISQDESTATFTVTGKHNGTCDVTFDLESDQDIDEVVITFTVNKKLTSIALSGDYPTQLEQGSPFSHEGMVVTATYDDGPTADVTDSAEFSGYNMQTLGAQTVTVSYTENNVTKTVDYTLTIVAPTSFTVTFDSNGGSTVAPITNIESGTTITKPTDPTKTNYRFGGWFTTDQLETEYIFSTPVTSNFTLYAKWILDTVHAGTQADPYTVADARFAIDANDGITNVYTTGIVSEVVTEYSTQFKNMTFDIVDNNGDEVFLRAYRCTVDSAETAADVNVGAVVVVSGNLTYYEKDSLYEYASGCSLVSVTPSPTTTYTVTYDANGGKGTMTDPNSPYTANAEVTVLANSFTRDGYTFDHWNTKADDSGTDYAPNTTFTINANTTLYAQWIENTEPSEWELTSLSDLTSTDIFVIVGNNGDKYAMSNDNGTSSAPSAVEVTVSGNYLTGEIADNIKWNVSGNATDGYTFYPNGSTTTWLYCTDANNGVRVGTDANKTFKIDSTSGYLKHTGTNRYLGIYSSQDWRCYTSTGTNIGDQTFAFYKFTGETPVPPTPTGTTIVSGTFEYNDKQSLYVDDYGTMVVKAPDGYTILNSAYSEDYSIYGDEIEYDSVSKQATFKFTTDKTDVADVDLELYWYKDGFTEFTVVHETIQLINPTGLAKAREFAKDINACCKTGAEMAGMWELLAGDWADLSEEAKSFLINAHYDVTGTGDDTVVTKHDDTHIELAEAMSRYDFMVEHYGMTNFMNKTGLTTGGRVVINPFASMGENSNMVAIVVIVSVVSLTAIGGYFFLKKRREQN